MPNLTNDELIRSWDQWAQHFRPDPGNGGVYMQLASYESVQQTLSEQFNPSERYRLSIDARSISTSEGEIQLWAGNTLIGDKNVVNHVNAWDKFTLEVDGHGYSGATGPLRIVLKNGTAPKDPYANIPEQDSWKVERCYGVPVKYVDDADGFRHGYNCLGQRVNPGPDPMDFDNVHLQKLVSAMGSFSAPPSEIGAKMEYRISPTESVLVAGKM